MKLNKLLTIAIMALGLGLTSCEYDNYEAPEYVFSGKLLTPDGKQFNYDSSKSLFNFFQSGYGKIDTGTGMRVDNNGHFQQLLFNADYKLTLVNHALPFEIDEFPPLEIGYDSIPYHINGNVDQTFTVRPYYTISNMTAQLEGKRINVTFDITKNTDTSKPAPDIIRAYVYLGTSALLNGSTKCQRLTQVKVTPTPDTQTMTLGIPLSYYRDKTYYVNNFRDYAYVKVGILLDGISDYVLVSDALKLENLPYAVE